MLSEEAVPSTPAIRLAELDDLALDPAIGRATARRTYLRKQGEDLYGDALYESRGDLAFRVAEGNAMLHPSGAADEDDLFHALRTGRYLSAGRHLQHGDNTQINRPLEVFTNCSTSPLTSTLFLLLLNGSGVGRSYDDDLMKVDWRLQPKVYLALDEKHADFGKVIDGTPWNESFISPEKALDLIEDQQAVVHVVEDSREGWAKAIEILETLTYEQTLLEAHLEKARQAWAEGTSVKDVAPRRPPRTLVLDFSQVRPKGAPIGGMQGRPASGPVPLMHGLANIAELAGEAYADWSPWKTSMVVDHELAATVAVGGIRRAARMATKVWTDPEVEDFVKFKRTYRHANGKVKYNSSNNSVVVDQKFYDLVAHTLDTEQVSERLVIEESEWGAWPVDYRRVEDHEAPSEARHAANVFLAATFCSYHDGTGEPGFINGDQLVRDMTGVDELRETIRRDGIRAAVGYNAFSLSPESQRLYLDILHTAVEKPMPFITNPCGEIVLAVWGGYCVIGDLGLGNWVRHYTRVGERPYDEVEAEVLHVARLAVRFLMRVNLMPSLWHGEVRRTNRIGVGLTGIHEFALAQFGLSFHELLDTEDDRTEAFWGLIERVSQEVDAEARRYALVLGVAAPHTATTIKPSGTISKLDNLTEGCHLPAHRMYLRNVQFQNSDALIERYQRQGYPVTALTKGEYKGVHIVGFPTRPGIDVLAERLGLSHKVVLAAEATPADQFDWLRLLERHWITGGGTHPGNQVSYTLKYNANLVDYGTFVSMVLKNQPDVRCCSVMPEFPIDVMPNPYAELDEYIVRHDGERALDAARSVPFEYVPEQILSRGVFQEVEAQILRAAQADPTSEVLEDIGLEHLDCGTGGCPIDFADELDEDTSSESTLDQ
jgi:ribonucleoside-triphosphate reductase (formate)